MLHVIGIILKIIGILLAVLLGTLVVVILLALFVPVRYRFLVKRQDDMLIDGKVHWLLHLMHGHFVLEGKKPVIVLRIFGIKVFDSTKPKKEKKQKPQKDKVKKAGKAKKASNAKKTEKTKKPERPEKAEKLEKPNAENDKKTTENDSEKTVAEKLKGAAAEISEKVSAEQSPKEESKSESEATQGDDANPKEEIKESLEKVSFLKKIRDGIKKALDIIRNLKEKIQNILKLISDLFKKKNLVSVFLRDTGNKSGIQSIFASLWGIIKHVSPHEVHGYFKFGTGDPYTTGEALAALSFVYAMYGDKLTIEPDFENKVFEAEVKVKGRVRLFSLLKIGIKLWRDDNFKYIKKSIAKLKEEITDGR